MGNALADADAAWDSPEFPTDEAQVATEALRTRANRAAGQVAGLERERERLQARHAEWTRRAELAVRRGRDDLARVALIQRSALERELRRLARAHELSRAEAAAANAELGALQRRLAAARSRQSSLALRGRIARARGRIRATLYEPALDDALAELERDGGFGVDASPNSAGGSRRAGQLDELSRLSRAAAIESELSVLRLRLGRRPGRR
jgi:phage shock protein A